MPIKTARGDKAKCDVLFSKIVRARGACEWCGSTRFLETSHIRSRHYSHTRTLELNAHCLCSGCHRRWHADGLFAHDLLIATRTTDEIEGLRALSLLRTKFDWSAELERLRTVAKEMQLL